MWNWTIKNFNRFPLLKICLKNIITFIMLQYIMLLLCSVLRQVRCSIQQRYIYILYSKGISAISPYFQLHVNSWNITSLLVRDRLLTTSSSLLSFHFAQNHISQQCLPSVNMSHSVNFLSYNYLWCVSLLVESCQYIVIGHSILQY